MSRNAMARAMIGAAALWVAAAPSGAQDSVATTPGGNDAIPPHNEFWQRFRYVVDLAPLTTSWGNPIAVGPILKATRDVDPMFQTHILGPSALSSGHFAPEGGVTLAGARQVHLRWTAQGHGIHPTQNAGYETVQLTNAARVFGAALGDFGPGPTNIVGAVVAQRAETPADLRRLYVERTTAAISRILDVDNDTATISLGSVDRVGNVYLRADEFNTSPTYPVRVRGENALRVSSARRATGGAAALNFLLNFLAPINSAWDEANTGFLINVGDVTLTLPTGVANILPVGADLDTVVNTTVPHTVAFDFKGRVTMGRDAQSTVTTSTSAHVASGVAGLRGNPVYSATTSAGGEAGTIGVFGVGAATFPARVDRINVFGLRFENLGSPPSVAPNTARDAVLPSPISAQGSDYIANENNTAEFRHWLGHATFRGPGGQVAVGQNGEGQLMVGATATDPSPGAGEFIAVATLTHPPTNAWVWDVAAHAGMDVLNGFGGDSIGALVASAPTGMSSPAIDFLGNVYFTARWRPTGGANDETGLFKAARTEQGYMLELLLTTGATINGVNSATPYTVSSITLVDAERIATGSFHSGALLQAMVPGRETTNPLNIFAMGGAVVNATITYTRGAAPGTPEPYEVVLFVGPALTDDLAGDANGDGVVDFTDLAIVLGQYGMSGAGLQGDLNGDGVVDFADFSMVMANYGQGL